MFTPNYVHKVALFIMRRKLNYAVCEATHAIFIYTAVVFIVANFNCVVAMRLVHMSIPYWIHQFWSVDR